MPNPDGSPELLFGLRERSLLRHEQPEIDVGLEKLGIVLDSLLKLLRSFCVLALLAPQPCEEHGAQSFQIQQTAPPFHRWTLCLSP